MRQRVFSWGEGLDSNLGDSILRRGLVRRLNKFGPQHIYVGNCSPGYLAGLQAPSDAVLYTSQLRWFLAIARSAAWRRTFVHMSPGEAIADRRSVPMRLGFAALGLAVRLRGGSIHQTGVGVRSPLGKWVWPLRLTSRVASTLTWRDRWSRDTIGRGSVAPDWAMGEGPPQIETSSDRDHLTVSLRGDRVWPSEREVSAVASLAEAAGLRLAVVSQVAADDDLARDLHARLGGEILLWGEGNHAEAEVAVRDLYSRTALILSDRVHALLVAATEGAVPRAFGVASTEKAGRTLDAAGFADCVVSLDDIEEGPKGGKIGAALSSLSEVPSTVAEARAQLDRLATSLPGGTEQPRLIRVLHSMAAPDGKVTRYADHMQAAASDDTVVSFFSWRRALLSNYDVLHIHWPEYLVRGRTAPRRWLKYGLLLLLAFRITLTRTKVVRTLHNLDSHEQGGALERYVLRVLNSRTNGYIALNQSSTTTQGRTVHIPHGHYIERFASYDRAEVVSGRVLFFGLIRPYKNVPALLNAFSGVEGDHLSLHIVGKPNTPRLGREIQSAAARDSRVTVRLEFVEDAELVRAATSAELVVLPYSEMHNSGVILVALSLGRVVLAPRSPVNEELQREVGADWLVLFDGPLTSADLGDAISRASRAAEGAPDLHNRDWSSVAERHRSFYRLMLKDV